MSALYAGLNSREIPSLNGIRAAAALTVVLSHGVSSRVFPGHYAVTVFFVLSGFLITHLLLRERDRSGTVDLRSFWIRRARRLLPAFYAFWLLSFFVYPQTSTAGRIGSALYVSNYVAAISGPGALYGITHAWSLAIEEQFYLLWPVIFAFLRPSAKVLAAVATLVAVARLVLALNGHALYAYFASETRCDALLAGCALALWLEQRPRIPAWLFGWKGLAIPAVLVGLTYLLNEREQVTYYGLVLVALATAIFIPQAVAGRWRLMNNPICDYLGVISYGIYLWHFVGLDLLLPYSLRPRYVALLAPVLAVAFASASFYVIERPFRRSTSAQRFRALDRRESVMQVDSPAS